MPAARAGERARWRRPTSAARAISAGPVRNNPRATTAWNNTPMRRLTQGFLIADSNSDRWRKGEPRRTDVLCLWGPLESRGTSQELLERPWSRWAARLADALEFMVPGIMPGVSRLDIYTW